MTEALATDRDDERAWWASFEAASAAILLLALAVSIATAPLPGSLRTLGQPGLVAAVLVAGFAWRPAPGLLAFALYILCYDTTAFYLGGSIRRVDEFAVPAIVLVALVRLRPWRHTRIDPLRDGAVALVVAVGILSSLVNGVPFAVWVPALALLWKTAAIFYVASWLPIDRRTIIGAARVVLTLGFVVLSLAFIESFNPAGFQSTLGMPIWYRPRGELPSVKSIFLHPAIFASFASLVTLYAYAGYVEYRRIWMLVFATFGAMTVFMAARRRAIAAATLGLAAAFAWSARRIGLKADLARSWVPVAVSGLVMVVIFLPGMLGLVVRTGSYLGGPPQPTPPPGIEEPPDGEGPVPTRARSALYGASVDIAADHFPLGAGLGRYGSHMSRVEYSPVYAEYGLTRIRGLQEDNANYITDTFWPMVLGEHGVFGLVGYAVFLAAILYRLWRSIAQQADRLLRAFFLGSLAVMAAALVESLATPMFVAPPRAYIVFAALGAAIAIASRQRPSAVDEPVEQRPPELGHLP
jgi:hypothetical protein